MFLLLNSIGRRNPNDEEIIVKVVAEVIAENVVPEADKAQVDEKVDVLAASETENVVVLQFLDLAVELYTASGEKLGNYNELSEKLTFTIEIPEGMDTEGKTFVVIRVHNGEVTILDTVMNADGTLSFETDKFSTYAIAYKEIANNTIIVDVEPIFVVLFSSILMGFGIGINMKVGGSTGGFDIIEAILLKYFKIPYSTSIYILDAILVVMGMCFYSHDGSTPQLFQNAFSEGLGATIYIFILGVVVDRITFGGFNKRAVFIQSSKYEEIHDAILNKLVR